MLIRKGVRQIWDKTQDYLGAVSLKEKKKQLAELQTGTIQDEKLGEGYG